MTTMRIMRMETTMMIMSQFDRESYPGEPGTPV